ncbi:MAG: B12-binding domain-containing radical SAM protein [Chitinispirillaceae bacterium]|nr:B12-binding domain-containing radical SAM protein [Chitinispirillaceae bacterium]
MKIGLVSPKGNFWGNNKYFQEYWHNNPNSASYRSYWTGLSSALLVVAALTPEKHEVELVDENFDPVDFDKDYGLVGVTCMTSQATRAYEIADGYRKRGKKVVLGGIHPTVMQDEAKQHADSVVIGEVEYLWVTILSDLENNRLKDFYRAEKLVDMKDSPKPRFDLLDPKRYTSIWVQTSRGCPHDCDFCAASKVYGKKYREKTNEQVLGELRYCTTIFKNGRYYFSDDNFFVNKSKKYELLEKITPMKIRWGATTDISIAEDEKLLELAYKSGCNTLFIGFESLSEANLESIDKAKWKFKYRDKYQEYIQKIQSYGIGILGAFIVGFDKDDSSVFDATAEFIIKNNLYGAQIAVITPFPGTRLRERLEKEGRITGNNWSNYTAFDVNYIPKNFNKDELERKAMGVYQKVINKENFIKNMEYFKNIHKKLQHQYR